jgi:hypothetical protein
VPGGFKLLHQAIVGGLDLGPGRLAWNPEDFIKIGFFPHEVDF